MQVYISEECVRCGICEVINPNIFVIDTKPKVNFIEGGEDDCIDAALICPTGAVKIIKV